MLIDVDLEHPETCVFFDLKYSHCLLYTQSSSKLEKRKVRDCACGGQFAFAKDWPAPKYCPLRKESITVQAAQFERKLTDESTSRVL